MKRKEAIERIQEHRRIHSKKEPFTPFLDKAFDMAIEALETDIDLDDACEQGYACGWKERFGEPKGLHGEWIPCSERLPEKDGKYLVTAQGYISTKNEVTTAIFVSTTKEFYPNCIAWLPLPEPYEEEEDDGEPIGEGYASNMFCDNSGYCGGTSCPNYFKCHDSMEGG